MHHRMYDGFLFNRMEDPAAKQDPRLFEKIKVKVVRPFYVNGELAEKDKTVTIERHLADSLRAIGKVS